MDKLLPLDIAVGDCLLLVAVTKIEMAGLRSQNCNMFCLKIWLETGPVCHETASLEWTATLIKMRM
jgi:hypothetical protein